jgi:dolichol-phosphate mannosyltransferase
MDSLYIVIPAYNEEENISKLIDEWYPIVKRHNGNNRSRLLIVDDGSRDKTADIVKDKLKGRPLLELLQKKNGGHGSALITGYRYAISKKPDFIFQTDSDRQTLPSEFEGFWRWRKKYEAIIGKRSQRQDGSSRVFASNILRLLIFFIFRRNVPDANTPYRLMRRSALREALSYLDRDESIPNVMISIVFAKERRRILYKRITFRPRQGGTNSIDIKKIGALGIQSIKRFIRLKRKLSYHANKC